MEDSAGETSTDIEKAEASTKEKVSFLLYIKPKILAGEKQTQL